MLDGLETLGLATPAEKRRGAVVGLIAIYAAVARRHVQEEFRAVAVDRAAAALRAVSRSDP